MPGTGGAGIPKLLWLHYSFGVVALVLHRSIDSVMCIFSTFKTMLLALGELPKTS